MKHLRIFLILAAGIVASVAFVYSCGGGGSGGGGGITPSIPYSGVDTPAYITSENAVHLATDAFFGLDFSGQTGGVLSLSAGNQKVSNKNSALINNKLISNFLENTVPRHLAAHSGSETTHLAATGGSMPGSCDGYADITGSVNASNGKFDLDVIFNGYSDDCVVYLNGPVNMKGSYPDIIIEHMTVTYDALTITGPDFSYTQSGIWSIDNRVYPVKETLDMVVRDESNSKTFWMQDYIIYTYGNHDAFGNYSEISIEGKYYDYDQGYVEFISTSPICTYMNRIYPFSGSLELTGSDSSKALYEFVSPVYSRCLCDADGNGTFEFESQPMPWPWSGNFTVYFDDLMKGFPAKSAVGYDGDKYFVATGLYYGNHEYSTLGIFVSDLGSVLDTITVADTGSDNYDIAFDGTNYLLVYSDPRYLMGSGTRLMGQRISTNGNVLDGPSGFLIDEGANYYPRVAFDGTNYLVVWENGSMGGDINGARISTEGSVLNTFPIYDEHSGDIMAGWIRYKSAIAFDGSNYLVVWSEYRSSSDPFNPYRIRDIYGVRVSPGGTVLDASAIPICAASGDQVSPEISFDGNNYMVIWVDGRNSTSSTIKFDIYGSRIATDGTILDPEGIEIKTGDHLYFPHSQFTYSSRPYIDFDGTNYLISWQIGNNPRNETTGIYADRLTTTGELVNSSNSSLGIPISGAPPACSVTERSRYIHPSVKSGSINSVSYTHLTLPTILLV